MNSHWKSLTPKEMLDAVRLLPRHLVQSAYELTDAEYDDLTTVTSPHEAAGTSTDASQSANGGAFTEFLKTEYNNIATAHFNSNTTITQFFQFYLLIVGIPISVAGVVLKFWGDTFDVGKILASSLGGLVPAVAGVVAVVGLFMLAYLVNLRLDAIQYARVVNGIRQYFYNISGIDLRSELAIRALPRTTTQPRFLEWRFFGCVVAAFALLDALYFWVFCWTALALFGATGLTAHATGRLLEWRYSWAFMPACTTRCGGIVKRDTFVHTLLE